MVPGFKFQASQVLMEPLMKTEARLNSLMGVYRRSSAVLQSWFDQST
jgi:hypothetical protein